LRRSRQAPGGLMSEAERFRVTLLPHDLRFEARGGGICMAARVG
jgi:hypothetical protein